MGTGSDDILKTDPTKTTGSGDPQTRFLMMLKKPFHLSKQGKIVHRNEANKAG